MSRSIPADFCECGGPKARKAARCMDCARRPVPEPESVPVACAVELRPPRRPGLRTRAEITAASAALDPRRLGGSQREVYGAIVSFEGDGGKRLTLHRDGQVGEAVRAMCAIALTHDESFRVVAISTPASVMGDLDGRTARVEGRGGSTLGLPERMILGQLGRMDLLHPRLQRSTRS